MNNSTPGTNTHIDTQYGNPLGDVVDNSSGDNLADNTSQGNPVTTSRGSGCCLSMYSKPSWLCK